MILTRNGLIDRQHQAVIPALKLFLTSVLTINTNLEIITFSFYRFIVFPSRVLDDLKSWNRNICPSMQYLWRILSQSITLICLFPQPNINGVSNLACFRRPPSPCRIGVVLLGNAQNRYQV